MPGWIEVVGHHGLAGWLWKKIELIEVQKNFDIEIPLQILGPFEAS